MAESTDTLDPRDLLADAGWIRRLARHLVRDQALAEDVVQDTWVAALRNPPQAGRPARPWLAEVLRNVLRMRLRDANRRRERDSQLKVIAAESGANAVERMEIHREVVELVLGLSEPYRSTLVLRYYDGLSAAEIARTTHVPPGTVRWRLKCALDDLRRKLDADAPGSRGIGRLALLALPTAGRGLSLKKGAVLMAAAKSKLAAVTAIVLVVLLSLAIKVLVNHGPSAARLATASRLPPPGAPFSPIAADPGLATDAATSIEGRVRDSGGRAVKGAAVIAVTEQTGDRAYLLYSRNIGLTDEDGRYRIAPLAAGAYTLTAASPSFTPGHRPNVRIREGEHLDGLDLTLGEGGVTLRGRVLDAGGGGIVGAHIGFEVEGAPWTAVFATDSDGRYAARLGRGSYRLTAWADGYARKIRLFQLVGEATQDVTLEAAARLSGRVVSKGTQEGIAGAQVHASGVGAVGLFRAVPADSAGVFSFSDLEPDSYEVMASKDHLIGRAGKPVRLDPGGDVRELVIEVENGIVVEGHVRATDGRPIGGARVSLRRSRDGQGLVHSGVSGDDGSFVIGGLAAGTHVVGASAAGMASEPREFSITASPEPLEIVVSAAVVVSGTVLAANGASVPGASVNAWTARVKDTSSRERSGKTTTDIEGRFTVRGLSEGFLWVDVTNSGSSTMVGPEAVAAGEHRELVVRLGSGARVSGTVRWSDGSPAAGAFVRASGRSFTRTGVVGRTGDYVLEGLEAGFNIVLASRGSGPVMFPGAAALERRDVVLGTGEHKSGVDLQLPRGGKVIRGVVLSPDGKPVAGAVVGATRNLTGGEISFMGPRGPHEKKGTSLDDGTFALEDLAETTYHVWAEYGSWPQARSLGVAAGSTSVRLQFRAGGSVSGVVLDAGGRSTTSGSVYAYLAEAGGESWERAAGRLTMVSVGKADVRSDGAFELVGLGAEAYDLVAKAADGRSGTLSGVTVRDGESKHGLRLVLESSVTVKGVVVEHGTGRPLAGAKIIVFLPGGEVVRHADADGVFRISGVVRGHPLRFIVFSPDANHIDDNRIVHVAADAAGEIDLGSVQLLQGVAGSREPISNLGWRLENIDGRNLVTATRTGDPVASAGILPGAVLLEVDGRDVTTIGSSAAGFLICGPVGSVVRVKIQQPTGGVRTVEFVRRRREG